MDHYTHPSRVFVKMTRFKTFKMLSVGILYEQHSIDVHSFYA